MQERAYPRRAERLRMLREERSVTEDGESFALVMRCNSLTNDNILSSTHTPPSQPPAI